MARETGEPWILRIEDIDTARVSAQHQQTQLEDLKAIGLQADAIVIQSSRYERHLELFTRARAEGRIYPCDCSRKDVLEALSQVARAPHERAVEYSGHCRNRKHPNDLSSYHPADTLAWRWKINPNSNSELGHHDVIIARTDANGEGFVPGYHWACAIDDADGNYRLLVRAWDLAMVEGIQSDIRSWCSLSQDLTRVFHTSVVTRDDGGRLEKRTQGVTLVELQTIGISPSQLTEKFDASFDLAGACRSLDTNGVPLGEIMKSVSLHTLLR